jgi:hypothetical protein
MLYWEVGHSCMSNEQVGQLQETDWQIGQQKMTLTITSTTNDILTTRST